MAARPGDPRRTFGVRSVTVRIGEITALDDVSVDVPPGSVVAIAGGDGAGKTTLLRTLVRQVQPVGGSVESPDKQRIGYLPASTGSWASLSVRQNIDFAGRVYGLSGPALNARRESLLAASGLTVAVDRLASALSGGMRRKLGFCMAIVAAPALLVLDEPTTGVDPVSRVDLWRLVSEVAAGGAAVIMSTTYLDEAERAGHLVVLEAGRVLVQGSYDDILAGFSGTITRAGETARHNWAWRRGPGRREYWPDGGQPADAAVIEPDLEDVVVALSLVRRNAAASSPAQLGRP